MILSRPSAVSAASLNILANSSVILNLLSAAIVFITPFDPVRVNAVDPAATLKVRIVNMHEDDTGDGTCVEVHEVLAYVNGDVVGVQETHVD